METKQINYTITFLSDWHAGSGLSSGADADAVVIKDLNNLPYLPGKTIKGLLKDVFEDIKEVQPQLLPENFIERYFDSCNNKNISSDTGYLFFSNAELYIEEQRNITMEMADFLYHNITSTSIGENGVAKDNSLRSIQVCIPVVLHGYIDGVEFDKEECFNLAFKYLRHIGCNRNRGLGRCRFEIKNN